MLPFIRGAKFSNALSGFRVDGNPTNEIIAERNTQKDHSAIVVLSRCAKSNIPRNADGISAEGHQLNTCYQWFRIIRHYTDLCYQTHCS